MQTPTITCPAELQVRIPRHSSRKERLAAEQLKNAYHILLSEADQLRFAMQETENHFNYLSSEKEIDACIFKLRTFQCQYASVLSKMKELQARMDNLSKEF